MINKIVIRKSGSGPEISVYRVQHGMIINFMRKAWFTIRRTATRRGASVFTMFVLSGSERDVRPTHPLYPRVRIGPTAW